MVWYRTVPLSTYLPLVRYRTYAQYGTYDPEKYTHPSSRWKIYLHSVHCLSYYRQFFVNNFFSFSETNEQVPVHLDSIFMSAYRKIGPRCWWGQSWIPQHLELNFFWCFFWLFSSGFGLLSDIADSVCLWVKSSPHSSPSLNFQNFTSS